MAVQPRFALALVIACGGLVAAGFSLWRALGSTRARAAVPPHLTRPEVLAALAATVLDTHPTPETIHADLERARAKAMAALPAGLALASPDDLTLAFREQLEAAIDGDYARHRVALAARGINLPDVPEAVADWNAIAAKTRLSPMGINALVVRLIYQAGRRVAPPETSQGYQSGELRRVLPGDPLPESPEAGGLTIVEVQLPMELPPETTGPRVIALTGFRFAWHAGRRQWLLWSVVQLNKPSESSLMPPI